MSRIIRHDLKTSIVTGKYKVKEIGVFGSYVRGEQSETSDIDILLQLYEPVGWEFLDLKEFLESILDKMLISLQMMH